MPWLQSVGERRVAGVCPLAQRSVEGVVRQRRQRGRFGETGSEARADARALASALGREAWRVCVVSSWGKRGECLCAS